MEKIINRIVTNKTINTILNESSPMNQTLYGPPGKEGSKVKMAVWYIALILIAIGIMIFIKAVGKKKESGDKNE